MKHFTRLLTSLKPGGCDSFTFGQPPDSVTLFWLTLSSSLLVRMADSSLVESDDTLLTSSIFATDGCLLSSCTRSVNTRLAAVTLDNSSRNRSMSLACDSDARWPAVRLSHVTTHFSHVTILSHYMQTFLQLTPFCDTVSIHIVLTYWSDTSPWPHKWPVTSFHTVM